jgi:hypothetical protein
VFKSFSAPVIGPWGKQVIHFFLQEEHDWFSTELKEHRYSFFRSATSATEEQDLSICVFKWLLAIAHSVYELQVIQSNITEPYGHLETLASGECWRDAFGDILEVDLSRTFRALKSSPTRVAPRNLFESFFSESGSGGLVTCELEEILLAIRASSRVVIDEILRLFRTIFRCP